MEQESRKQKQMVAIKPLATLIALLLCMFCMSMGQAKAAEQPVSAMPLPTNEQWGEEHWITDTDTEQWYRIEVPSDGYLSYKVMTYTKYVVNELYNEDLSSKVSSNRVSGTETSPGTDTYGISLSTGTYYLKIYPSYSDRGKYKLLAGFEPYNTNDSGAVSYDSPQTVQLGSNVTGAFTWSDREDWYRVTIPAKGYYHYQVSAYTKYVAYTLYNEDLSSQIAAHRTSGSDTSPGTETHDVVLSAGTYYFKFNPYYADLGKYIFTISSLDKANCDHDYKMNTVDSTYTKKGYTTYKCQKCGNSYKDNYTEKKTLETPYLYTPSKNGKKVTVSWYSVSDASGYQIYYKSNGNIKTLRVKGQAQTNKMLQLDSSGKHCVVKIRAYRTVGKKTVYSKWSLKKTV